MSDLVEEAGSQRMPQPDRERRWPKPRGRAAVADHILPLRAIETGHLNVTEAIRRTIGYVLPVEVAPSRERLHRWLRFSLGNGQGLCRDHHAAKTAEEQRGVYRNRRRR